MKIEIPEHGAMTLDEFKSDIELSKKLGTMDKTSYSSYLVQGLINKIEELQSDISALESEMDSCKK